MALCLRRDIHIVGVDLVETIGKGSIFGIDSTTIR